MVAGFLIVARLWVSWALVHLSPPTTSTAFLFLLAFWCLCHAWQSCPMFAHSVWGLRCFCYFICPPPPLFSSFVFQFLSVFPGFLRLSPSIVGCVCLCRPLSPFLPSCVLLSPFVSSHVSPSLRGCPFCLCLAVGSLCLPLFVSYHWRLCPPLQVLVSFCLLSFVSQVWWLFFASFGLCLPFVSF